ncbi:hypothetical protein RUND412_008470 [Rhizina undulata]
MSEEANQHQQQANFPMFHFHSPPLINQLSRQVEQLASGFRGNQAASTNNGATLNHEFPVVPALSSQAVGDQIVELNSEHAALSPAATLPLSGSGNQWGENVQGTAQQMIPALPAAMTSPPFLQMQASISPIFAHIVYFNGQYYILPGNAYTNISIPSFADDINTSIYSYDAPPPVIFGASPMASNIDAVGDTQQSDFSIANAVATTSATPAVNEGAESSTAKRHRCSVCGSYFTRSGGLKAHRYTHTGERPFVCTYEGCVATFTTKSNLNRHWKSSLHERLLQESND